jgi:hypothetical protein
MGHSSVAFTLDVYGHLFANDQEFLREQAGLLAGVLPALVQEVAKSGSSKTVTKTVAAPKKRGCAVTQPLDIIGSGG